MQNAIAAADAHYARELGRENPDRAWVASDRDVWYPNPFYRGPAVPHPEDDDAWRVEEPLTEVELIHAGVFALGFDRNISDEIPF